MTKLKALVAGAVAASMAMGLAGSALAAAPPFEPDTNAIGSLTFYNASGAVITGGNLTDSPFAAFVQASAPGRTGDNKATVNGFAPVAGENPLLWSGDQLGSSTTYPNASAPGALATSTLPVNTGGAGDESIATLMADFPNTSGVDANIYELRLYTSGPGQAADSSHYDRADIMVNSAAGTWTLVFPLPVTQTQTTLTVTPASPQLTGTNLNLSASVTPSNVTGTVVFEDGGTPIGPGVSVTAGSASTQTSSLAAGSHQLTAVFTPTDSTDFGNSTSNTVPFSINNPGPAVTTTVGLSVNTGQGQAFQPVTFTANVAAADGTNPNGSVTFIDNPGPTQTVIGTTPQGQGSPGDPLGTYVFATSALAQGAHSVVAQFNPASTAAYTQSTSAPQVLSLAAPQFAPAVADIIGTIPAGTLVISTPYTASNPLNLGALTLNGSATGYSGSAVFSGIDVNDSRAGDLPWTVSVEASNLSSGPGTINSQNVGLTGLTIVPVAGNALPGAAGNVTTQDNPAATPPVAPGASGSQGLGGGFAHELAHANQGIGTIGFSGTLILNAPTSTPPGAYTGTITFTIG